MGKTELTSVAHELGHCVGFLQAEPTTQQFWINTLGHNKLIATCSNTPAIERNSRSAWISTAAGVLIGAGYWHKVNGTLPNWKEKTGLELLTEACRCWVTSPEDVTALTQNPIPAQLNVESVVRLWWRVGRYQCRPAIQLELKTIAEAIDQHGAVEIPLGLIQELKYLGTQL